MITALLRILGVTPTGNGKTGKREAAWTFTGIVLGLTVAFMAMGREMFETASPLLMFLWTAAASLLAGAYGLDWKAKQAGPSVAAEPDQVVTIPIPDGAVG